MIGDVEVVESVADAFAHRVTDLLAAPRDGRFSFFFSGGPTAAEAYARLATVVGDRVDWSTVDAYWGDDRCVPLDSPDSNHRLVHEHLLDAVGPAGSDHPMYTGGDPAAAAAAYQDEVARLPHFDLVHLGLGPDGHCASLFPHSPELEITDPDQLVVDSRDPNGVNELDRITLTLPGIARARLALFTVEGESKREAVARLVAGDDLPAGRVRADRVVWLLDRAAAGDALG